MTQLRHELGADIDQFFVSAAYHEDPLAIAGFMRDNIGGDVMTALLSEVEHNPVEAVDTKYSFNIGFDRITFACKDTDDRASMPWRLRAHLFEHTDPNTSEHMEPTHLHRWLLGSTVLAGDMEAVYSFIVDDEGEPFDSRHAIDRHAQNKPAQPFAFAEDIAIGERLFYYAEGGRTDIVVPRLIGAAIATKHFGLIIPAGHAYAQRPELAHGVKVTAGAQPVITAALMSTPWYIDSVYLEPTADFPERPGPGTFSPDALSQLASRMKDEIKGNVQGTPIEITSPYPTFLKVN